MQVTGVGEPGPFQDSLQAWANGGLVSDLYGASLSLSELWHPQASGRTSSQPIDSRKMKEQVPPP